MKTKDLKWIVISMAAAVLFSGCQSSSSNPPAAGSGAPNPAATPSTTDSINNTIDSTNAKLQTAQQTSTQISSGITSASSAMAKIPGAPALPTLPANLPSIPGGGGSSIPKLPSMPASLGAGGQFGSLTDKMFGRIVSFTYDVQSQANNNDPVLVEFLVNYSDKNSALLAQTLNQDWFNFNSTGAQGLKQLETVVIYRWQVVPDSDHETTLLKIDSHAVEAFLFIRYNDLMNAPPRRLDPYKNTFVFFGESTFGLTQFGPDGK